MKRMLVLLLCVLSFSLFGNRVIDRPVTHNQNGEFEVDLLLSGDEFFHYLTDKDGYTVVIDPKTDLAVYAGLEGDKLIPTPYIAGKADPRSLGMKPRLLPSETAIRSSIMGTDPGDLSSREGHAPTTGTINNLVIFIRFLDQAEYTQPISVYEAMLNSSISPSMRGFFLEESANQLTINSTFYPAPVGGIVRSFQDGHNRGYFSPWTASNPIGYDDENEGRERLFMMLWYAVNSVSSSIPGSLDLDADNDGEVDNIIFICQGATDNGGNALWPHHNRLYPTVLANIGLLHVTDYNLQLSDDVNTGVLAHEFSHTMNFPDLYHYNNNLDPVGSWDTQCSQSTPPQHHTTYMKYRYGGWTSAPPVITPTSTPTQYTLTAIDQNPYSCYKIASTRPNEYYMLEYRRDTGTYESGVPATGLLVYRIISSYSGSALWGNRYGPPDELYVYRPGVDANNVNGWIDNGYFSRQSGRTELYTGTDPSPWLYGDGAEEYPGNLVILDVGNAGGSTISFTISNTSPNLWLGIAGTEWTEPLNWSHGTVPTVNDDVVVDEGYLYYPYIREPGQACKSLTIKAAGQLIITTGSLEVADNLLCYGDLSLSNNDASLYVYDDLSFFSGSGFTMNASGADLIVEENLRIASGANFTATNGYLEFSGTTSSTLYCDDPSDIYNLRIEKSGGGTFTLSSANTAAITINGGIYVNSGTFYNGYSGNTILKGSLNVYSGGAIGFYDGSLRCEGSTSSSLRIDTTGSYLRNLTIAKTGTAGVSLSTSNIIVGGELRISSGYLNCGGNTLAVGGNWVNTAGPDSFYEGTGRVVFNGQVNQTVSSETFNILEVNKNGQLQFPAGSSVLCAVYDWTSGTINVSGGSFTASDLADDGIFGSYILSGGSIDFTQDSSHYVDLRSANINISSGVFAIHGGGGPLWMSYLGTTTFTMSGGYFDVRDQDILIGSTYPFIETITGGYIRTSGDFTVQRTDFNPTGGYVELWGGSNATIFVATGSNLKSLLVNKTSAREEATFKTARDGSTIPLTRANTVSASGNLSITDYLIIMNGVFDVSGFTVNVSNDLQVLGQLKMSSGTLNVGDIVTWNGSSQVTGGTITCSGAWTFGPASTAVLTGSTVILNNPYGAILANNSTLTAFGSLELSASEENPVFSYTSTAGAILKVNGALTVSGMATLNLFEGICQTNSLLINTDCALIVGDGGSLDVATTLTLNGSLDIGPGTVTTHGFINFPATGMISTEWGSFTNDAPWFDIRGTVYLRGGLNIDNGSFEIRNNNVQITSHPTRIFSNAMLIFGRNFTAVEPGAYQPIWGSLILNGGNSSSLYVTGDNYLSALEVAKTDAASVTLYCDTYTTSMVSVDSGVLNLNGYLLDVQGVMYVYGELYLPESSTLRILSGWELNIYYNGVLRAEGSSLNYASITRSGTTGYYALNVFEGGTIAASWASFEFTDPNGVYIHDGATVDPVTSLANCRFMNGAPGGYLLRIDNSQNFTVNGAQFPTNTWSGAGNVRKTVNAGNVSFIAYSGAFSGSVFESDPYNRIAWQLNGIMPVLNLSITQVSGANPIQLTWEYPYPHTGFRIYASDSPDGTFTLISSSPNTFWSGPASTRYKFYRVTALN